MNMSRRPSQSHEARVEASLPSPAILDAPRPERTQRHGPKPHAEKKPHDKQQRRNALENQPVDRSQLPAFLFRKVPVAKREPQE